MSNQLILDANVLLRYLTNDIPAVAQTIEKYIQAADDDSLFLPDLVLFEITFILSRQYKFAREVIAEKLIDLVQCKQFSVDRGLTLNALMIYKNNAISFTDAYLAALSIEKNIPLYTLDMRLHSIVGLKVFKPSK